MKVKAKVLAPVIADDGSIVTSGEIEMDAERAAEYEKFGKLDVFERDGEPVLWPGCCDHTPT